MSHNRNLDYLIKRRIIYRRSPITDKPTESFDWGDYYEDGTYECYELFRSKAKITTYKSLKWHMLVLWYLNPQLDQDEFQALFKYICNKRTGFITFTVNESLLYTMVYEVSMMDLDHPPRNKQRKIIFKEFCKLTTEEKLSVVGGLNILQLYRKFLSKLNFEEIVYDRKLLTCEMYHVCRDQKNFLGQFFQKMR